MEYLLLFSVLGLILRAAWPIYLLYRYRSMATMLAGSSRSLKRRLPDIDQHDFVVVQLQMYFPKASLRTLEHAADEALSK